MSTRSMPPLTGSDLLCAAFAGAIMLFVTIGIAYGLYSWGYGAGRSDQRFEERLANAEYKSNCTVLIDPKQWGEWLKSGMQQR